MEFPRTFFCYLLEPLVSSMHWVLKWYKIPWNLSFKILMKMVFNCAGWINFHKLINTLYLFASPFHQFMFYYQYLHYTLYAFPALFITLQNIIQNLFWMLIETFWSKSSMEPSPEFHGTFWTKFEQHLWFHGIPWNSMEFSPDPKFHGIPWNFFHTPEFHGIPWNSMELLIFPQKVPWNSMELDQFHI